MILKYFFSLYAFAIPNPKLTNGTRFCEKITPVLKMLVSFGPR